MENKKYFSVEDNFKKIISDNLNKINSISQIETGWTNFVYKVSCDECNYIFRFPRNEFFSNALIKEYKIITEIKDKIGFLTPNFILKYDKDRPYTIHKEIEGESLSSCYNKLDEKEKKNLAFDICRLLDEFSKIDITKKDYQTVSNFLDNLSLVSKNNYDIEVHNELKKLENEKMVFSHGDFNPGNLLLKNKKLVAIIDFSFSGISSPLTDLSRIIGRCPNEFKDIILKEYENYFKTTLNIENLNKIEKIWAYVEEKYIMYIKQNHPSIILPDLV